MKESMPLPQAVDIEQALLGICLTYPDAIHETGLTKEMFYRECNGLIYSAILELSEKGPADLWTVTNLLRDKGMIETAGGFVYITKLTENVYTDSMTGKYSLIIKEKYLRREYIRMSEEIQNKAFDETIDLSDLIEFTENSLFKVSDFTQNQEPEGIDKCIEEVLIEVEQVYKKEKTLVGVPSGFTSIDRITGGWQPGNLVIIAGRPSMGKTALALVLAKNPAKLGYPVCLFSLEMSKGELTTRFLSSVSGYTNIEIRNAKLEYNPKNEVFNFDKLVAHSRDIASLPIFIDPTPSIGLNELRSKVKKQILLHGVKLIIVDYLQLMTGRGDNREQEVSSVSRGLKSIAKEFNISVVALSQLNRGVEDRADKRPRLSDLRESGAIEQDADIVCFVYRPAVYGITSIKVDKEDMSTEGLMVLDGAKDRNGALFSKPLYHNISLTVIGEDKIESECAF